MRVGLGLARGRQWLLFYLVGGLGLIVRQWVRSPRQTYNLSDVPSSCRHDPRVAAGARAPHRQRMVSRRGYSESVSDSDTDACLCGAFFFLPAIYNVPSSDNASFWPVQTDINLQAGNPAVCICDRPMAAQDNVQSTGLQFAQLPDGRQGTPLPQGVGETRDCEPDIQGEAYTYQR